jgi:predicted RNA binding protein YcfA (HicA-like mRNA interferase family)
MTFWDRVARFEARGVPRPVALRAARIMEARGPHVPWDRALHPTDPNSGRFIESGQPRKFVGSRFPAMTPRQIGKMLAKAGFTKVGQKGSHAVFEPPGGGRKVVVPMHGSQSIPRGTLMSILAAATTGALAATA